MIEKELLMKSLTAEQAESVLEERYSWTGQQKPVLLLADQRTNTNTLTKRQEATARHLKKYGKRPEKKHVVRVEPARTSLRKFINDVRSGAVSISYTDFEHMNDLWQSYITDLSSSMPGNGNTPAPTEETLISTILSKLPSADFHGALLRVSKSVNPTTVGISGIVIWEARSAFLLVTKENKLKMIEKRGSMFEFCVPTIKDRKFEILGSRFLYRTADRSGRKFKVHSVDDL